MKCATHPEVETNLRCGKCEKPICPRCMIQTPVGARCRDCARLNKLPTYRMSPQYYFRAVGSALGMAAATGALWGLVASYVPFFYLNILLGAAVGYGCAEVISLAVNRKRGKILMVIAGLATGVSYVIALIVPWGLHFSYFDILAIAVGIFVSVSRLR
jgi:hypothetical protein